MKNLNPTQTQYADQSLKGAVLGAIAWAAVKWDMPAELLFLATTAASFGLAYLSTFVGDENLAQFIGSSPTDGKPVKVGGAKVPAKKAAPKKAAPKKAAK